MEEMTTLEAFPRLSNLTQSHAIALCRSQERNGPFVYLVHLGSSWLIVVMDRPFVISDFKGST